MNTYYHLKFGFNKLFFLSPSHSRDQNCKKNSTAELHSHHSSVVGIRHVTVSAGEGLPGHRSRQGDRARHRPAAGPGRGHRLHHGEDRGQPGGVRPGYQGTLISARIKLPNYSKNTAFLHGLMDQDQCEGERWSSHPCHHGPRGGQRRGEAL